MRVQKCSEMILPILADVISYRKNTILGPVEYTITVIEIPLEIASGPDSGFQNNNYRKKVGFESGKIENTKKQVS